MRTESEESFSQILISILQLFSRYEFKDVVQPPTDPAYKEALEMKKTGVFSNMNAELQREVRKRAASQDYINSFSSKTNPFVARNRKR